MTYNCELADLDDIDALLQFCAENFVPTWQFCSGVPPYPDRNMFAFYIARGNPCVLAYDGQGLAGYRIVSKDENELGKALWGLARRDINSAGEELAELAAEMSAYVWHVTGSVRLEEVAPVVGDSVAEFLNSTNDRALEVYNEKYV